jgi:hypothetical protein
MTIRQTNLAMKLAAAVMIAGGLIAFAAAMVLPLEINSPPADRSSTASLNVGSTATDLPPLESFDAVFNAALRPQAVTSSSPVAASAAGMMLVGTIGDNVALVQSNNNVEARIVGERFDGNELLAVRSGEADVRTSDGMVTLRKSAEAAQPQYIHGGRTP